MPVHSPTLLHTLHKEPGRLGEGAGIHGRTGLRCLCGHGLETPAHGEHLVPAISACAAQGLGAAVGTTPQLLHLLLEPLRSGTKDRKHSSGWSKDPTTPGTECTECRRNSQRTPESLVQASCCCCYRVIQEWIFNVCEQQMVLSTSVVKSWQ